MILRLLLLIGVCVSCCAPIVLAQQKAPEIAYMYPPGGQAGQTVDVTLGGYDWTPDMQLFVHDERIKLEIVGKPGPVIVPEPPYWFGKKARRSPFPMPRETPARLTIPADVPPGLVAWQAANANGATTRGYFVVGAFPEVLEIEQGDQPQEIESLPVTINGQVKVTADVDRYRFRAEKSGPITCLVTGRKLGLDLNAMVDIFDDRGQVVVQAGDTSGNDLAFTFAAEAGRSYTAHIYDADFRGDRAFVYRLTLAAAPRVAAAVPNAGKRGETRSVQFWGYGLQSGAAQLESVTKEVTFPAAAEEQQFVFALETPHGTSLPYTFHLSDLPETVEPAATAEPAMITLPSAITGTLSEAYAEDRYRLAGVKGDIWSLDLLAARIGSPLDVALAIQDAEGKELVRSDDLPGSTDAALQFTLPADGTYTVIVSDVAGRSGSPLATYRLVAQMSQPGFSIDLPEQLAVPLGGTGKIPLKATRSGGFDGQIKVTVSGLPAGVSVQEQIEVPEKKPAGVIELAVAADAAAVASLLTVTAEAQIGEKLVKQDLGKVLLAITMPPPFSIDAEGKDDVTKWPRGTTFPGPVLIERKEGFNGEIVLEMTSKQGRVCQGIWAPEMTVPPGVNRVLYPIFLPEWLETTRTSRMVTNGVAKIADPKGNVRYVMSKMITRIGFLPEGALLKLDAAKDELQHVVGQPLAVPLEISRSVKLTEPLTIELITADGESDVFSAAPINLSPDQTQAVLPVQIRPDAVLAGERTLTIRATALREGQYPVVSEASVVVTFGAATSGR